MPSARTRDMPVLHVMGMWNAEVMRLNTFSRAVAKNVLGGRVFGAASWPRQSVIWKPQ